MNARTLGQKINADKIIHKDDSVDMARVYIGSFIQGNLVDVTNELSWNDEQYDNGDLANLSLKEIAEQLSDREERMITVVELSTLSGSIYQYGNYGNYWVYYGTLFGYA